MSFRDLELKPTYETGVDDLLRDFYVPVLREATHYDRFGSYFTSASLAVIGDGLIGFVENDGTIRLVVNTALDADDIAVLRGERDAPTETLREIFDPAMVQSEVEEVRWKVLAWLLENDRLQIKISTPKPGRGGIFHAKLGILRDKNGNELSFIGGNNETIGGWERNYENFSVHKSWVPGLSEHVQSHREKFQTVWDDNNRILDTYDVPDALERDIIDESPDDIQELLDDAREILPERIQEISRELHGDSHSTLLNAIKYSPKTVGGTHIPEQISPIDPWPHQRIVSDTLYSTYPKGFLLCDEVGLGKTIEAGLTISRLVHTGDVRSCLILAPANLTTQWQEELWEKFNLNSFRYDRVGSNYVFTDAVGNEHSIPSGVNRNGYAWEESPVWRFVHDRNRNGDPAIVIASWHLARMSRHQDTFAPRENGTTRTVNEVPASCRGRPAEHREGVWDLTIVDEAHKARRRDFSNIQEQVKGTPNNLLSLLRDMQEHSQCSYILTATPMQIHPVELYDLLSLAGVPEKWDDARAFLGFFETRLTLAEVLENPDPDSTGQATIKNGGVLTQQTLGDSDDILTRLSTELGVERTVAKRRVLTACELARSYDESHNGVYPQSLSDEIDSARDSRQLHDLLYREDAYVGIASDWKREQAIDNLDREGWELVLRAFEEATPVDVHLHRNTRDVLREYQQAGLLSEEDRVPHREVRPKELDLGDASEVYEHIEEYVQEFHRRAMEADEEYVKATGFVMTVYRQRMTSSFHAIKKSLERRLGKLRSTRQVLADVVGGQARLTDIDLPDSEVLDFNLSPDEASEVFEDLSELDEVVAIDPDNIDRSQQLINEEIEAIEEFIDDVQDLITTQDPKLTQLRDDIRDINSQGRDRVMIFTQYGDTLEMIRDSLVPTFGRQVGCYSGRGGEMYIDGNWQEVGKERVKQEFSRDDGDVEILVCTESASHGLNLQKCGVIVNYDLPWNPMRVEQRIGRIDRIGQTYDPIWIYNYYYKDTVEMDAYDVLQDRVGLFEEYVGGMQPIFSNVEGAIHRAAMEGGPVELDDDEDESHEYIRSIMEYETVEDARLNGWDHIGHPDIGPLGGDPEYPHELDLDLKFIENVFTDEEITETLGVSIALEETIDGDWLYILEIPADEGWSWIGRHITEPESDSLAEQFFSIDTDRYRIPITFSTGLADEYPSIRLFAYGDPIFDAILSQVVETSNSDDVPELLTLNRNGEVVNATAPWLLCGWLCDSDESGFPFCSDEETLRTWIHDYQSLEETLKTKKSAS